MIEILLLAIAVLINSKPERFHVCLVLMWLMIANQAFAYFGLIGLITEFINFHVYISIFELIVIGFLSFNRSILSIECIFLAVLSILANIITYWFDLLGANTYLFFDLVMYGLFGLQLILLYSIRISNGLFGYIARWLNVYSYSDNKY